MYVIIVHFLSDVQIHFENERRRKYLVSYNRSNLVKVVKEKSFRGDVDVWNNWNVHIRNSCIMHCIVTENWWRILSFSIKTFCWLDDNLIGNTLHFVMFSLLYTLSYTEDPSQRIVVSFKYYTYDADDGRTCWPTIPKIPSTLFTYY